jgi:hypothetical protein
MICGSSGGAVSDIEKPHNLRFRNHNAALGNLDLLDFAGPHHSPQGFWRKAKALGGIPEIEGAKARHLA